MALLPPGAGAFSPMTTKRGLAEIGMPDYGIICQS